jgi:hypothetical protein
LFLCTSGILSAQGNTKHAYRPTFWTCNPPGILYGRGFKTAGGLPQIGFFAVSNNRIMRARGTPQSVKRARAHSPTPTRAVGDVGGFRAFLGIKTAELYRNHERTRRLIRNPISLHLKIIATMGRAARVRQCNNCPLYEVSLTTSGLNGLVP